MRIINKHNHTKYEDVSKIEASMYVRESLKEEYGLTVTKENNKKNAQSNVKKLEDRKIHDIMSRNRSQVPASRGDNKIKFIVLHYLGVPNAQNNDLYGGGYGGHYNIYFDGTIYKAANPKIAVVWHCGGKLQGDDPGSHKFYQICTNYNSIGIECSVKYTDTSVKDADGDSNKWYFTEETQESLVYLVSKLMDEYGITFDHVIRHWDVTDKTCPNPYVKNNGLLTSWTWDEFKANLAQYRKDGTITIPDRSKNPVTSSHSSSYTLLKKGSSGSAVKELQTMLIACGYPCGSAGADGSFGGATYAALKAFQRTHDLDDDGIYGAKSKAALTAAYKVTQESEEKKSSKKKKTTTKKFMIGDLDYSPVFDPEYYRKHNPDLQRAFGDDVDKLWRHMRVFGLKEGRQASANFNPRNYRERYPDLKKAFGYNWPAYYEHWLRLGSQPPENRIGK
jgi:N-acetylmuramoyl-L-alanine amidase CwlA